MDKEQRSLLDLLPPVLDRAIVISLENRRKEQSVTQSMTLHGELSEAALRRDLHDALDRMIFSALAAERNSR